MTQPAPGRPAHASLEAFSEPTRRWFQESFGEPTPAQVGAWAAISAGEHALVVAPTGSGKTLSAFLWAIDRIATTSGPSDPLRRCRVLYISPLKALAVDVERNLTAPLVGIRHAAARDGTVIADIEVAVRSGDTPAQRRRSLATRPPDILITTPESLFLMLTSSARTALSGVETVVVDEIHALAGTKRGAHLALSLERLDALLERPAQRIGLSATVRPVPEVARFLAGGRPVTVVDPPARKRWDLSVVVPVADLAAPGAGPSDRPGSADADPRGPSIWPYVEERIVDLVAAHRSTLVFANSRRLAERLTARLNEIWADRSAADDAPADASHAARPESPAPVWRPSPISPAELIAQSGLSRGAAPYLAKAHHGSVSKEQRALIEDELKAGRLPAVVATSSLELGIDMGTIDLVIQVESPPSVASGLQRVGRAGHQVGAVSTGVLFPKFRGDLVQTAVVAERMRTGQIEALHIPANPLDVLAQQIVAMCALDEWDVDELEALVRRSAPFTGLTRPVLHAVLDMLAGRYPSEEFAELRPRIVWDRVRQRVRGRPGAQRLAVTSGGTIPDRGLYGVFLAGEEGTARRVGELDEEMVYESRVGDVFTLGTTSWRIEDLTHDRVVVSPAPGQMARLPFWKGDGLGRPAELGRAVGELVRELSELGPGATDRLRECGLDEHARTNLLDYLAEQRQATGVLPTDRSIVIERFRDELGDWQIVIHSPFGSQVHAPWALCVAARLQERFGVDVSALHSDDGIVLRLPDLDGDGDPGPAGPDTEVPSSFDDELADLVLLDPAEIPDLVTSHLGSSALFAARFRECAARALLLPRRTPGRRQALWQQRQRSAQLLQVASGYPSFPIVLEAVREVVQDVYDVPALVDLMRQVAERHVQVTLTRTAAASPFARSLLFGYIAQYLYEGDSPLAERRAAALALDPALLADLLGTAGELTLRDLLDPIEIARTEAELQHLTDTRRARHAEDVADLLRVLGPLTLPEVVARSTTAGDRPDPAFDPTAAPVTEPGSDQTTGRASEPGGDPTTVRGWLDELVADRRVIPVVVAGQDRWAAVEDAGRLQAALGTALPPGIPTELLSSGPDPLADLVVRYARSHGPFTVAEVAHRWGVGTAVIQPVSQRLVADGRLVAGALRPDPADGPAQPGRPEVGAPGGVEATGADRSGQGGGEEGGSDAVDHRDADRLGRDRHGGDELCDPVVLRVIRRRSLAALRSQVEPVPQRDLARFLPAWQQVGGRARGVAAVHRAVEQLTGAVLPAGALETLVLPSRVAGYAHADLDELMAAGEVIWCGHAELAHDGGWVSLHLAELAPLTVPAPTEQPPGPLGTALLEVLGPGGGFFFPALVAAVRGRPDLAEVREEEVLEALWGLVWSGRVTNDTLAPLRARLRPARLARAGRPAPRARTVGRTASLDRRAALRVAAAGRPLGSVPDSAVGRWSLVPRPSPDETARALARAESLLDRYGVVTRGAAVAEDVPGGFAAVYRVLAAAEEAGRVRRGYFVEGLGAAQFGTTGAVDRLRAMRSPLDQPPTGRHGPSEVLVLAAADPANPYGAALPWPSAAPSPRPALPDAGRPPGRSTGRPGISADPPGQRETDVETPRGHQPARKAGSLVVLVDGRLAVYLERGGRSLLSYPGEPDDPPAVATALAQSVRSGALPDMTLRHLDGRSLLGSGHPLEAALRAAGFIPTPKGLRLRR